MALDQSALLELLGELKLTCESWSGWSGTGWQGWRWPSRPTRDSKLTWPRCGCLVIDMSGPGGAADVGPVHVGGLIRSLSNP